MVKVPVPPRAPAVNVMAVCMVRLQLRLTPDELFTTMFSRLLPETPVTQVPEPLMVCPELPFIVIVDEAVVELIVPLLLRVPCTLIFSPPNVKMPPVLIVKLDTVGPVVVKVAPAVLLTVRLGGPAEKPVTRFTVDCATVPNSKIVAAPALPPAIVPVLETGVANPPKPRVMPFKVKVAEATDVITSPTFTFAPSVTFVLAVDTVSVP